MKVLVCVKRVIDAYVKIRVKSDGSGVETTHVKMSMDPFDEIAMEEAVRLKEQGVANSVVAVSIGETACQETLRMALALGADEAILVETAADRQPLAIAKLLKALTLQQQADLVLLGKQSIDGDNNQTGQMLAALLDWPQGTYASKLTFEDGHVSVTREIDQGLQTLRLTLPAVITTDLRLNKPRYATLPNIMQAKRKALTIIAADELGDVSRVSLERLNVAVPPVRQSGEIVADAAQLVEKLKTAVDGF